MTFDQKQISLELPEDLENITNTIIANEGRVYLVGGGVLDSIQGFKIKDWDLEVFNLTYGELEDLLSGFGEPNIVGKSFGIIKLRLDGMEYDFAIPREENRIGIGHRDFSVTLKSDISPKEAAIRRDLTINSMYVDLYESKLIDYYGGLEDCKNGVIRATNKEKFIEDPLRVLRIMQLLPRKGQTVEKETMDLSIGMIDEFPTLSKERVYEEFYKLLLLAEKPSIGLNFLKDSGWIKWFPELEALIGAPQNPEHHPEGDVWIHTLMAVDNAAKLRKHVDENLRTAYMFGVLCHDFGKPYTTNPITLTAYGHDEEGVEYANSFMKRLTNDKDLIRDVKKITQLHMRSNQLVRGKAKISAWKRLHNKMRLDILAYVSLADGCARPNREFEDHETSKVALEYFTKFGEKPIPKILTGAYLVAKGILPGPKIGEILKIAYEIQIEKGIDSEDSLFELSIDHLNNNQK